MLIAIVILLGVCLIASIVINFALYKAGETQMLKSELYEEWIVEFKKNVLDTYTAIKELDSKEIFQKDDEVGVVFKELVDLIAALNSKTQEEEE